jgi:mono/diheme cytochrome c family protein
VVSFNISVICAGLILSNHAAVAQTNRENPENTRLIDSIQGPALFKAYCAVCHGADGRGAGPLARGLKTRPADLTRIAARNAGIFPSERVQNIIAGEEQVAQGHGTREMPVWGPIFSQIAWDLDLGRVRIDNLVRYLKEIQAK